MQTETKYDSTADTKAHISRVKELIQTFRVKLMQRKQAHDLSKLEPPEKEAFDNACVLKVLTYGSPEYKQALVDLGPALQHHYEANSHHPEHYANGIDGMSLLDVVEMFCDWKAAGERHADGSIERSIKVNTDRFKLSPQLVSIFQNTAKELNWK